MNANELADHMEKYFDSEPYCDEVVTMLRQQQAEISLLREYVCQLESGLESSINLNKAQAERQAKTLTDDEIVLVWNSFERTDNTPFIDFARAILKKASEK